MPITCLRCKPKRNHILNPALNFDTYGGAFETIHLDHFHLGPNILFPQMQECLTIICRKTSLLVAVTLP